MTNQGRMQFDALHQGRDLSDATAAVILIHGRGATADSILRLARPLDPDGDQPIAWVAPQAEGNSWYPYPFLEPIDTNEPQRANALWVIDVLISSAIDAGISQARIGLIGFSQGACLSLEYAGWGERQPGFIGALSGGVMGPLDGSRSIAGDRTGMDIFIGCGDQDNHIPLAHAERAARLFRDAGASVDYREYPGMNHTISEDEIRALREAVMRLVNQDS